MEDGKKENNVVPAIESIVTLIHKSTSDKLCTPAVLKASIGLLGDLGTTFGNRMFQIYSQAYILQLLQEGRQYEDMADVVTWAHGIVMNIRAGKQP